MHIIHKIYFLSCFLLSCANIVSFSSITELKKYTDYTDELALPSNRNFLMPNFLTTYLNKKITIFDKIAQVFGFQPHGIIDLVQETVRKIESLVFYRELQGYGYRHVSRLFHTPGEKLIVWTDLQGAFHSFARGLEYLNNQGIIDDNFNVVKKDHYLIINSNAMGIASANLELLFLIITLMEKNPQNVFYIAGTNEDRDLWVDQGLMQQVSALLGIQGSAFVFKSAIQYFDEVKKMFARFFDTLPLALYIDYQDTSAQTHNLIRISGLSRDSSDLEESMYGTFFEESPQHKNVKNSLLTYRLEHRSFTQKKNFLRAILTSIGSTTDYEPTQGLIEIEPRNGTTVWSEFSGPTVFNRSINDFFYDAFVTIDLQEKLSDVTISLFNRDVRLQNIFTERISYNLLSGREHSRDKQESNQHVETIIIGANLSLSRGQAFIGRGLRDGAISALTEINDNNTLIDKSLHIAFFDDKTSPHQSYANVQNIFASYQVSTIAYTIGATMTHHYADKIKSGDMLLLFPIIGNQNWHSSEYPGIISFRPSLKPEIKVLMEHAIDNADGKKFCCLFQDDEFGRSGLNAMKEVLSKHNVKDKDIVELSYLRNSTNFKEQVSLFKKQDIDVLLLCSFTGAAREFILQLGVENLMNVGIYAISTLDTLTFKNFLQEKGLLMNITHVVPNPATSDWPIVQEYRKCMDSMSEPYNTLSLEGYITTSLIIDAVKNIQGPVNMSSLRSYFAFMKNKSFKGMNLSFDEKSRDLSKKVWLQVKNDPQWREFTD